MGAINREEQQLADVRELMRRRKDLWQSMERYIAQEIDRMGGYGFRRSVAVGDYAVNEDAVMGEAGASDQRQNQGIAKGRG